MLTNEYCHYELWGGILKQSSIFSDWVDQFSIAYYFLYQKFHKVLSSFFLFFSALSCSFNLLHKQYQKYRQKRIINMLYFWRDTRSTKHNDMMKISWKTVMRNFMNKWKQQWFIQKMRCGKTRYEKNILNYTQCFLKNTKMCTTDGTNMGTNVVYKH